MAKMESRLALLQGLVQWLVQWLSPSLLVFGAPPEPMFASHSTNQMKNLILLGHVPYLMHETIKWLKILANVCLRRIHSAGQSMPHSQAEMAPLALVSALPMC